MPAVNYFWDEIEDNVVREYDENNNTIANYTTEPTLYGSVLSQERSGVTRIYHFDGQGNTTELTDENGNVTDTRRYSAFGEVTESTGTTVFPFGFGGRWGYDNNNNHQFYVRARYFSCKLGVFITRDPMLMTIGANPQVDAIVITVFDFGRQSYEYAGNSPIQNTDPSGLFATKKDCEDALKKVNLTKVEKLLTDAKCPVPPINCVECGAAAFYDPKTKNVTVCYGKKSKINTISLLQIALDHELFHAYDHCKCPNVFKHNFGEDIADYCRDVLCTEIRAVSYSKNCQQKYAGDNVKINACIMADASASTKEHKGCTQELIDKFLKEPGFFKKCVITGDDIPVFPFPDD